MTTGRDDPTGTPPTVAVTVFLRDVKVTSYLGADDKAKHVYDDMQSLAHFPALLRFTA